MPEQEGKIDMSHWLAPLRPQSDQENFNPSDFVTVHVLLVTGGSVPVRIERKLLLQLSEEEVLRIRNSLYDQVPGEGNAAT